MSISVNIPDPNYQEMEPDWKVCRDVMAGKRAIFGAGETYLPKLSGQNPEEYSAYQKRAGWYGASGRTRIALSGMIFRKDPIVSMDSEALEDFKTDVTMNGVSIEGFSSMLVNEILETGRAGILLDHQQLSEKERSELTQAEYEARNYRVYAQLYSAEQIIGIRTSRVNNKTILTQIRLRETEEQKSSTDEFKKKIQPIVRVLELNKDGIYQQRIFKRVKTTEEGEKEGDYGKYEETETIVPKKNGAPFNYIPFWIVGVQDQDPGYDKPPLLDLCEVNLDYYRTKADYKHGLHFTGLPTAVITGHDSQEGTTYRIGSQEAWVFREAEADAKYLEFTGQGLSELREELRELKNDMASLGARMLATEKRQSEAAETHQIKRSAERSMLASIANNCSEALTSVCKEAAEWMGEIPDEVSVRLNTDFSMQEMSTEDVVKLWTVVQGGGILYEDFLWNLHRGERLNPEIDDDERQGQIQTIPMGGLDARS